MHTLFQTRRLLSICAYRRFFSSPSPISVHFPIIFFSLATPQLFFPLKQIIQEASMAVAFPRPRKARDATVSLTME
ncbi:hypothetical protein Y032_0129g1484 [Ancylostoma ceylanicum]|uniref:Uncharacterized protein n=1 Tax=Ancylostoma ceylanicum TaxID=53326 RepID=A0A016T6S9_9BILA|nr:hypothetical protein Y032_0129g1484 [Ancylostoma ceylanicum]